MLETIPTTFLTADAVQFCSKCNEYLSVGPVTILSNKPLCGRCPNPMAAPASFYDRLAQHMFFPCINDRYGCDAMLAWGSVKAHEKICKCAPVVCPALNCLKKLKNDAIIEHFETDHKELVVSNREFKVSCGNDQENTQVNKFFVWNNQGFILKMNVLSSACFYSVSSWGRSDAGKLKFNLLIEDEHKRHSFQVKDVPIENYEMKHHDNATMSKLEVAYLKRVLNAKTIVCTICIGQESRRINSVNEKLLSEVECPICMDYMKPPVYMCTAGHSICNSCKSNVTKCPSCRGTLRDNRNVALEKIIEHLIFPCRNRNAGCCFTGTLSNVALHERNCSQSPRGKTKCYMSYIKHCPWSGPLSEMMSHLSQKHPESHFDLNYVAVFDLENFNFSLRFTEYNGQIFKVHVSRYIALDLQFGVQLVRHPSLKNSKYQFHIDFRDLNKTNRILKVNGNCIVSAFDDDNLIFDKSFVIHNQLLKHFAKDNVIEVKINLVECCDCIDFYLEIFAMRLNVTFSIFSNSSE